MTNHLANATSPYLLQHAENPVEWYPWGNEPLERAKKEDKPIFLSIGYAACHWCHVMAHESFENPKTASIMNQYFINIKVDREERPDLDSIYMEAVVALTGQGGWPMSVFLTPQGKPFLGGTYFPPIRRYNMPGFSDLLLYIANAWEHDRQTLLNQANEVVEHIQPTSNFGLANLTVDLSYLDQAAMSLAQNYDWTHGGWGKAPKFPQPMTIEFLLRKYARGDNLAGDMALNALSHMAKGGMYDILGGGFARYSTDDYWLVPHFEKMLYDNAQLANCYLHAYLLTKNDDFKQICCRTLDFVLREMTHPNGGFFSSLDADSEGEEGKYYTWTEDEIQIALDDSDLFNVFVIHFGLEGTGNFEGKWILTNQQTLEETADRLQQTEDQIRVLLLEGQRRMLQFRERRQRPGTDDKVLAGWNGLMMAAFAEAGRYLGEDKYIHSAEKNAGFILNNMMSGSALFRAWRDGRANQLAYLEDYSSLCLGLLSLYQTTGNQQYYLACETLAKQIEAHFRDPQGGFFDTSDGHERLVVRPKSLQDNAVPSGNAMAAMVFLVLSAFSGNGAYRDAAERTIQTVVNVSSKYPTAFSYWLSTMDMAVGPIKEIALLYQNDSDKWSFLNSINQTYRPRFVLAQSIYPPEAGHPALLDERDLIENKPTGYVCQEFVCLKPTNNITEFAEQLKDTPDQNQ